MLVVGVYIFKTEIFLTQKLSSDSETHQRLVKETESFGLQLTHRENAKHLKQSNNLLSDNTLFCKLFSLSLSCFMKYLAALVADTSSTNCARTKYGTDSTLKETERVNIVL